MTWYTNFESALFLTAACPVLGLGELGRSSLVVSLADLALLLAFTLVSLSPAAKACGSGELEMVISVVSFVASALRLPGLAFFVLLAGSVEAKNTLDMQDNNHLKRGTHPRVCAEVA